MVARVAAQEIMPRFGHLQGAQIHAKTSAFDLVTEADEAAEAAITAWLLEAYPQAAIVGEEATAHHPAVLDALGMPNWCLWWIRWTAPRTSLPVCRCLA